VARSWAGNRHCRDWAEAGSLERERGGDVRFLGWLPGRSSGGLPTARFLVRTSRTCMATVRHSPAARRVGLAASGSATSSPDRGELRVDRVEALVERLRARAAVEREPLRTAESSREPFCCASGSSRRLASPRPCDDPAARQLRLLLLVVGTSSPRRRQCPGYWLRFELEVCRDKGPDFHMYCSSCGVMVLCRSSSPSRPVPAPPNRSGSTRCRLLVPSPRHLLLTAG